MADEKSEAPVTEEVKSEATDNISTNAEQKPAEQLDLQGFTPEQLKEMKAFYDANGGFEKVKSRISNPEPKPETPAQVAPEAPRTPETPQAPEEAPTSPQNQPKTPAGAITADEMMAKYYFEQLSKNEKYASIAKEIADGSLLKEMSTLGIEVRNPDGSFNDAKINAYLSIKAQTVPTQPSSVDVEQSSAPTVSYTDVGEEITTIEQARTVLTQSGHPMREKAREFVHKTLNPDAQTEEKKA